MPEILPPLAAEPSAGQENNAGRGEEEEAESSPTPLLRSQLELLAIGGFDDPLSIPEDFLPFSDELGEDDTLPLPFGMEKPEKADYSRYELPFETTLPLAGRLTSGFGYREHPINGEMGFHYGEDIAAETGAVIVTFADGKVIAAGDSPSYGKYLMIRHNDDYVTLYAHCSKITAKVGKNVKKGDGIAKVGSTGNATGPHLHFELRKGKSLLNPEYYLD